MRLLIGFAFLLLFLLESCEVTEPERFFNKETEKNVSGILYSDNYDSAKVFTANGVINFRLDSLNFQIKDVYISVDSSQFSKIYLNNGNSFTYTVSPFYRHDGYHSLIISVSGKGKGLYTVNNVGLLNYLVRYKTYSGDSLKSSIDSVNLSGKPIITWKKVNDMFFTAYKLVRMYSTQTDTVAVITDPAVTSFTDENCPEIYGFGVVSYKIVVCSKFKQNPSTVKTCDNFSMLTKLPYQNDLGQYVAAPGRGLIHTPSFSKFVHADLIDSTVYSSINFAYLGGMKFSIKKNLFLFYNTNPSQAIFQADFSKTLSNIKTISLTDGSSGQSFRLEEIFTDKWLIFSNNLSGVRKLILYDVLTGETKPLQLSNITKYQSNNMTSNRDGLVYSTDGNAVYQLDARDTAHISFKVWMNLPKIQAINRVKQDQFLAVQSNQISTRDQDFNLIRQELFPKFIYDWSSYDNICAVCLEESAGHLYQLKVYDLNTFTALKTIMVSCASLKPIVLSDGTVVLYIGQFTNSSSLFYCLK